MEHELLHFNINLDVRLNLACPEHVEGKSVRHEEGAGVKRTATFYKLTLLRQAQNDSFINRMIVFNEYSYYFGCQAELVEVEVTRRKSNGVKQNRYFL